jgi:hypothetical protein
MRLLRLVQGPTEALCHFLGWNHDKTPAASTGRVHLKYDPATDLLFAYVGDNEPSINVEVDPGVTVRISKTSGRAVGVEVPDCSALFHIKPAAITRQFARDLLARYGPIAQTRLANR